MMLFKKNKFEDIGLNGKKFKNKIVFTDMNYSEFLKSYKVDIEEDKQKVEINNIKFWGNKENFSSMLKLKDDIEDIYFISQYVNDINVIKDFKIKEKIKNNVNINGIYIPNIKYNDNFLRYFFLGHKAKDIALPKKISHTRFDYFFTKSVKKVIDLPNNIVNPYAFFVILLISNLKKEYDISENIEILKYFYDKHKKRIDNAFKKIVLYEYSNLEKGKEELKEFLNEIKEILDIYFFKVLE